MQLAFTPRLYAKHIASEQLYRLQNLVSCDEDLPLVTTVRCVSVCVSVFVSVLLGMVIELRLGNHAAFSPFPHSRLCFPLARPSCVLMTRSLWWRRARLLPQSMVALCASIWPGIQSERAMVWCVCVCAWVRMRVRVCACVRLSLSASLSLLVPPFSSPFALHALP